MVPVERQQFRSDFFSYSHSITIMGSVWSVLHVIDRVRDTGITDINVPIPGMLCRLMFGIKWCDDLKMMRKLQYFRHYGLTCPINTARGTKSNTNQFIYNIATLSTFFYWNSSTTSLNKEVSVSNKYKKGSNVFWRPIKCTLIIKTHSLPNPGFCISWL